MDVCNLHFGNKIECSSCKGRRIINQLNCNVQITIRALLSSQGCAKKLDEIRAVTMLCQLQTVVPMGDAQKL